MTIRSNSARHFIKSANLLSPGEWPLDYVEYVGFTKLSPLPSDLQRDQLKYYLLFRTAFRFDIPIRSDTGYTYMLAQEILNNTLQLAESKTTTLMRLGKLALEHHYVDAPNFVWAALEMNAIDGFPVPPVEIALEFMFHPITVVDSDLTVMALAHAVARRQSLVRVSVALALGLTQYGQPLFSVTQDETFVNRVNALAVTSWNDFCHVEYNRGAFPDPNHDLTRMIARSPFTSFIHQQGEASINVAKVHPNDVHGRFVKQARNALRLTHQLILDEMGCEPHSETITTSDMDRFQTHMRHHVRGFLSTADIPADIVEVSTLNLEDAGEDEDAVKINFRLSDILGSLTTALKNIARIDGPDQTEHVDQSVSAVLMHERLLNETGNEAPLPEEGDRHYFELRTILDLDRANLKYYLWWRTQWRAGKSIAVRDYLLGVYLTEIVNLIGFDTPQEAYEDLYNLLETYSKQIRSLRWIARDWMRDFARVHRVSDTPARAALRQTQFSPDFFVLPDVALAAWLKNRDYDELHGSILFQVTGFDPDSAKYASEAIHPERLWEGYRACVKAVAQHFELIHGVDVFDYFTPEERWISSRDRIFQGVPTKDHLKSVQKLRSPRSDEVRRLHGVLENALKYAENHFRKAEGFSGRRQVKKKQHFNQELRKAIDVAVLPWTEPAKERIKIEIDADRLKRLESDSHRIREKLVHEDDLAAPGTHSIHSGATGDCSADAITPNRGLDDPTLGEKRSPNFIIGVEESEYEVFFAAIADRHLQVLTIMVRRGPREELERIARANATMLDFLLEEINELAIETLSDTVIDPNLDPPSVLDEHLVPFANYFRVDP